MSLEPLLKSLHLLPVRYRIIVKICTFTYQALFRKQPSYLHSLLTPLRKPVLLRSSNSDLLFVHKVNTSIWNRVVAVGAPTLSNIPPSSIKSVENSITFRRHLKTLVNISRPTHAIRLWVGWMVYVTVTSRRLSNYLIYVEMIPISTDS